MKLLLILAALGAMLWLWRGTRATPSAQVPPQSPRRAGAPRPPSASNTPVPMVACAFCGLHVPRAEAFESPSRLQHYCCEAHRIEHLRQGRAAASGSH